MSKIWSKVPKIKKHLHEKTLETDSPPFEAGSGLSLQKDGDGKARGSPVYEW